MRQATREDIEQAIEETRQGRQSRIAFCNFKKIEVFCIDNNGGVACALTDQKGYRVVAIIGLDHFLAHGFVIKPDIDWGKAPKGAVAHANDGEGWGRWIVLELDKAFNQWCFYGKLSGHDTDGTDWENSLVMRPEEMK